MLQLAAGEQIAGRDQRVDHTLVGVALLALVVDDARGSAFRVRPEARRVFRIEAVVVDGEGDRRVDAARFQIAAQAHPRVEILAAMAGRGMNEAGAGIVGDVIAGDQRDGEVVAASARRCNLPPCGGDRAPDLERMIRDEALQVGSRHACDFAIAALRHARLGEDVGGELVGQHQFLTMPGPARVFGIVRRGDLVDAVCDAI